MHNDYTNQTIAMVLELKDLERMFEPLEEYFQRPNWICIISWIEVMCLFIISKLQNVAVIAKKAFTWTKWTI